MIDASAAPHPDRWRGMCELAALISLVVIAAFMAVPLIDIAALPYAGGAAVVLGLGAMLFLRARSRTTRLAVALGLLGLVSLRLLSALLPEWLPASHGAITTADGVALGVLIAAALGLSAVAWTTPQTRT